MKRIIAVLIGMAMLAPAFAFAFPGNSGNAGNHGGGTSGGTGSANGTSHSGGVGGGGGSNPGVGGGNGGQGSGGGPGGGGEGGGGTAGGGGSTAGGGSTPGGGTSGGGSSPSVSATAAAGNGGTGGTFGGFSIHEGAGAVVEDLRYCTSPSIPHAGLVSYTVRLGNGFTYGGYEWAFPDFVQCMKARGAKINAPGRNELTNFGTRPWAAATATIEETDRIIAQEQQTPATIAEKR